MNLKDLEKGYYNVHPGSTIPLDIEDYNYLEIIKIKGDVPVIIQVVRPISGILPAVVDFDNDNFENMKGAIGDYYCLHKVQQEGSEHYDSEGTLTHQEQDYYFVYLEDELIDVPMKKIFNKVRSGSGLGLQNLDNTSVKEFLRDVDLDNIDLDIDLDIDLELIITPYDYEKMNNPNVDVDIALKDLF